MLRLALFFLVVSIVAAIFGFGGVAAASADIARILFFIAIVVFVVLLVAGLMAGSTFGSGLKGAVAVDVGPGGSLTGSSEIAALHC